MHICGDRVGKEAFSSKIRNMGQGTSTIPMDVDGGPRRERTGKQIIVTHCPHCNSYLHPPFTWVKSQVDPEELLKSAMRNMKNSDRVRIGDARTEKSNLRRKLIEVIIEKEAAHEMVVEFLVEVQSCESCSKGIAVPEDWQATVRLRHNVPHKKCFYDLLLALYKSRRLSCVREIRHCDEGMDFLFQDTCIWEFDYFLRIGIPLMRECEEELISDFPTGEPDVDSKWICTSEMYSFYTEDLIFLHREATDRLRNFGPLAICTKFDTTIDLLDPLTLKQITNTNYIRWRFTPLFSSSQLVEYRVVDVQIISSETVVDRPTQYVLADVQVMRGSDSNENGNLLTVRCHLGHLLNPGDYALGYDLEGINNNVVGLDDYENVVLPDVVLIRKGRKEPEHLDLDVPGAAKRTKISIHDQSTRVDHPQDHSDFWVAYCRDSGGTRLAYWDDLTSHKLRKFLFDLDHEEEETE